jgi:hypothetical protein
MGEYHGTETDSEDCPSSHVAQLCA